MFYVLMILPILTYIFVIYKIVKSNYYKESSKKYVGISIFMCSTAVFFAVAEALYIKVKGVEYTPKNILIISIMTLLNMACIFFKGYQVIKLLKDRPLVDDNSLSIIPKMTSCELFGVVGFILMMLLFK